MDKAAFSRFNNIRDAFRQRVASWSSRLPGLEDAQRVLAAETGDVYDIETPIVYNRALDDVVQGDRIAWIVVADNPGKREQEAANNRYLVGRSGMVAERFFARELGIDFRTETIIINKTPIHTAKTVQLRRLVKLYPQARVVLEESQRFMASIVPVLQACCKARVWVMGLSELKPRGLFESWQKAMRDAYADTHVVAPSGSRPSDGVYGFNHFSMGSFATALKRGRRSDESTMEAVLRIGAENRSRIL
ncbi:MAG: hypothetical protein RBT62_04900 [Spirochaetia bacterium]|jgi:hypothetical protein|nr:hypothetical protein [Spirochaetia bacterium]